MHKKKVLFVTYGGGHVNMTIPVIKVLQKNKNLELVVLGLTTAGDALKKKNIPYIGFMDLLLPEDQRALEWGNRLIDANGTFDVVSKEESIAYMGLSYVDLENRYGVEKAAQIYRSEGGRQSFFPLSILERFLRIERPDLVVATSSPRAERAAITAAANLSIPAVCLVDLFAIQEVRWIGQPGYANKVCVLSDYVKQRLTSAGRRSESIEITGNPIFDLLAEHKEQRDYLRIQKKWGNKKKVFLWASQPEPELHQFTGEKGDPDLPRKIDQKLFDILESKPDWQLVVRLHPNENVTYSALPENVEISNSDELLSELLTAVDVVLTMSSTVGLEAALLGKPLIALNLSICNLDAPFSEMGIAKGVGDLNDLAAAMESVLSGEWECVVDLPSIGDSTSRVVSVINEYL